MFSCWIFRGRAPAVAARRGWFEPPEGTVCLEGSFTSPGRRRRGIASGAWSRIADRLELEGVESVIIKVEVQNTVRRKAAVKSGYREVGLMELVRVGPRTRVRMTQTRGSTASELARTLRR